MSDTVDVIVPRGGRGLIERVRAESRIPVHGPSGRALPHLRPPCGGPGHGPRGRQVNAKMRRTGICGATETLLIDRPVLESHLPAILATI